uniref:Piwi domain-containing protein n=1 Tax=Tetradesmus obliquus TaxID=3088 RepID=A0A383WDW5_TETOB|eukprot:jgi/Sobl393_1/157/SZX74896.1
MLGMHLRCSFRRSADLAVSASQLRPPPLRSPAPGGDRGPRRNTNTQQQRQRPGQAPSRRLSDAADRLRDLWQRLRPQDVDKDPATGICLAPATPGQLGQPVRLLTNHLAISKLQAAARYRITITPKAQAAAAAAPSSKQQPGSKPAAAAIPLDVRQQLLEQAAKQQGWAKDSWMYDASSNRLFSLQQLPAQGSVEVAGGKGGASIYEVSISLEAAAGQPTTPGSTDEAHTLQQLSLVLKASLQAALLPQGAVETARALLLPRGNSSTAQPAGPAAAAAGRGSAAAGRGARGGRGGRGGGRGGGGAGRGGVLQWWSGLCYGVKPGQQSLTVQLDTTSGAVLPAGPLAELLAAAAGVASPAALCKDRRLLAAAERDVKGAKVSVDHRPGARVNVWGLDPRTPQQFKFKLKGSSKETTVADYFRSAYPTMRFSHLHDWPCVMVSQTGAAVPLEVCSIAKPQPRRTLTDRQTADLIKLAALPPEQRLAEIMRLVRQAFSSWQLPLLKAWGVTISPQLLQVVGRVLPDAQLQYAKGTCADAANTGQWRAPQGAGMLQPPNLKQWAVLNLASQRFSSADVQQFVAELTVQLQQQGGAAAAPAIIDGSRRSSAAAAVQAAAAAAAAAGSQAQLLLVVLPDDSSKQYGEVKAAAAQLGVATQCMVASAAGIGSSIKKPYVASLLLKVAAKAGGVAWQLPQGPELWAPTLAAAKGGLMVVGVDVGHGIAGGSGSKPSMAGIVGTLDASCSRYGAVVQEQTPGHEIVLGLQQGLLQLLQERQQASGQLPGALLVYRDGVSDSQYLAVLQQEVPALRAACRELGGAQYNPKVTYVVVSKSHGTRLFPDPSDDNGSDGRTGNTRPGTVVDSGITAPLKYEFFLNSHAGIQGTNRPGRYNVLVDDSWLGPDGLQLITQHLASTYAACTRTISCPAVVRYADKAAGASWAASAEPAAAAAAASWTVLQPASAGVKALQFRTCTVSQDMAGLMWFV